MCWNQSECPNPWVCPIGYTLCADNTCVKGGYETCETMGECGPYILCPDHSCAKSMDECPSMITCPLEN